MKHLIEQFLRFAVIGGITTVIDFAVLLLAYQFLDLHYLIATAGAFIVATLFNYVMNMRYVFVSRYQAHERHREIFLFVLLSVIGLFLTQGLMYLLVEYFHFAVVISKVLVTGVVMFFNFFTRKWFIEAS